MSDLVRIWGDCAVDVDLGAVSLSDWFGVYSKPANSKERVVIEIKSRKCRNRGRVAVAQFGD